MTFCPQILRGTDTINSEEGARFPISMVASGVWSGDIPLERAHNLREVGGGTSTMRSELERIGYLGKTPASHDSLPMAAHFELHIEQGPILETEKKKIGVVQGVQAYRWFTIDVKGRGSQPPILRLLFSPQTNIPRLPYWHDPFPHPLGRPPHGNQTHPPLPPARYRALRPR